MTAMVMNSAITAPTTAQSIQVMFMREFRRGFALDRRHHVAGTRGAPYALATGLILAGDGPPSHTPNG